MDVARTEVVLYADHNQFYVVDAGAAAAADDDGELDNASLEDHVAGGPGSLTVFTATYGYVRVILERPDEQPGDDLGEYDHVVEAPFEAASGSVSVLEVTEPKAELAVPPGKYVARVAWSGVEGADERDPDADDVDLETLRIQLWPGRLAERRVVKWYRDWKPAEERPANPHGLRVLVGRECDELTGLRVVGTPKDAEEYDDRSLVRAADGTHWLHYYSRVPPYSVVMLELPESELDGFDLGPEPPRVALDETDVAATIALDAGERYRYFLDAVRQSGWLWELEDAMSPVTWQDEDGRESILVWPHPRFAELYADHEAPGSRPVERELGAWLETVETYYAFVVVFPVSLFDAGRTVATPGLAAQLRR